LPNGDAVDLESVVKNKARKPALQYRNWNPYELQCRLWVSWNESRHKQIHVVKHV
jgi:hypothetical protein